MNRLSHFLRWLIVGCYLVVGWLYFPMPISHAQESAFQAEFIVANQTPLIGEPVGVTLRLRTSPQIEPVLPLVLFGWPLTNQASEVRVINNGNETTYEQDFTVIFWQTGTYPMPPIRVSYRQANQDAVQEALINPITFTVPSVLNPDDLEFRTLYGPALVTLRDYALLALGLTGLFLFLLTLFLVRSRLWQLAKVVIQRLKEQPIIPVDARLFHEEWLQLARAKIAPKQKFERLFLLWRAYLNFRLQAQINDYTTDEIARWLSQTGQLTHEHTAQGTNLLYESEFMRFSSYQPTENEYIQHATSVKDWVDYLESQLNHEQEAA